MSSIARWILTIPHVKCAGAPHGPGVPYGNHPCDRVAGTAATLLEEALKNAGAPDVIVVPGTNVRACGDLNRYWTGDREFHQRWQAAVRGSPRACVLDIHSYDEPDTFDPSGQSALTILDASWELQGRTWTKPLADAIGQHWHKGGAHNYISITARQTFNVPAVVIEFWEGLSEGDMRSIIEERLVPALLQLSEAGRVAST